MTITPRRTASSISAVIAMVGVSTMALPAIGADFTIQNGQTVGGQTLPLAGDTGTIEAGGTINGVGASDGVEATGGVNGVTINNAGTVTSASQDGIDVNDGNTIVNSGTVTSGNGGGDEGIEAGANNNITNSGTITSSADDGIQITNGNTITNSGTITGGNGGRMRPLRVMLTTRSRIAVQSRAREAVGLT